MDEWWWKVTEIFTRDQLESLSVDSLKKVAYYLGVSLSEKMKKNQIIDTIILSWSEDEVKNMSVRIRRIAEGGKDGSVV
jgi:hypothetical protein